MLNFLRGIKQTRWHNVPWLREDELSGDVFKDLATTDGKLSVYEINDDKDRLRVAVAIAATKNKVENFDYIIFDGSELPALGFSVEQLSGTTPDKVVNGLHYDIQDLTVEKLALLAHLISNGEIAQDRILKKAMKTHLREAVDRGFLEESRIRHLLDDP